MNLFKLLPIALLLLSGIASAQNLRITRGALETSASASLDTDAPGGTLFEMDARLGVFIRNYIQVGGQIDWATSDDVSRTGFAVYSQRLFETRTYLLPYVGAGLGYGSLDVDGGESDSGIEIHFQSGIKYFISDNVSLTTELSAAISSNETFLGEDEAESVDLQLNFGFSYLW